MSFGIIMHNLFIGKVYVSKIERENLKNKYRYKL
jgi:hypothetical protein